MARRKIPINFDINARVLREDNGSLTRVAQTPFITFAEEAIIQLQLVTDSNNPGTTYKGLGGDSQFQGQIDKEFDTPLLMTESDNSKFNISGDWKSNGDANVADGQLSIRVTALTQGFKYKVGTKAENPGTKLEVISSTGLGVVQQNFRMPFRTLGALLPIQIAIPAVPQSQLEFYIDETTGNQGFRVLDEDGTVIVDFPPAGA